MKKIYLILLFFPVCMVSSFKNPIMYMIFKRSEIKNIMQKLKNEHGFIEDYFKYDKKTDLRTVFQRMILSDQVLFTRCNDIRYEYCETLCVDDSIDMVSLQHKPGFFIRRELIYKDFLEDELINLKKLYSYSTDFIFDYEFDLFFNKTTDESFKVYEIFLKKYNGL